MNTKKSDSSLGDLIKTYNGSYPGTIVERLKFIFESNIQYSPENRQLDDDILQFMSNKGIEK
jgi:hypothetical protein